MRNTKSIILGVLIVGILVLALGPFLVPVPPLEDTVPPRELADPDSQFITVNGIQVHYKTAGSGKPVFVLLHGFGASVFSWRNVMPSLAKMGTVIAYDRPAFGLTERPLTWEGESPYGPQAQVDLLIGLLDALNVQQAILVGNSAGGTVALQAALTHLERVQAVVAVDAAVYGSGGMPTWIRPLLRTPQMMHLGPLIARQIQKRGPELIQVAWHDPTKLTLETLQGYQKPLRAENWDKALWLLTVFSKQSALPDHLSELNLPVLVITGDDDRIVPIEQSLRLADDLARSELVVIPNCGHLPQEECPEAFLEAIRQSIRFLNP